MVFTMRGLLLAGSILDLPPVPERGHDGLLSSIDEVLIGPVLICLLVRTPHGTFGGDVRSLFPCDAGVTGAPGEDHPLVKGSLDIVVSLPPSLLISLSYCEYVPLSSITNIPFYYYY
jgi:hypothetical protein